jgi:hypothetical protein
MAYEMFFPPNDQPYYGGQQSNDDSHALDAPSQDGQQQMIDKGAGGYTGSNM